MSETAPEPSSNQQRGHDLWNKTLCNSEVPGWSWREVLTAALDAAEARGRAELAAKVEALAVELKAEHRREVDPYAWGERDAADRFRALVAEQAGDAR